MVSSSHDGVKMHALRCPNTHSVHPTAFQCNSSHALDDPGLLALQAGGVALVRLLLTLPTRLASIFLVP